MTRPPHNHGRIGSANRACAFSLVALALFVSFDCMAQDPGSPVEAALRFFEAGKAGRCDEVWGMLTAGTRENIRAEFHRYERERDGPPRGSRPEDSNCWRRSTMKPGSARIVRQQGDEVIVSADFTEGSKWIDLYKRYREFTEELRLVREEGAWRVEKPRARIGRPQWELVEVGPVDVFYGPITYLPRREIEATAVARAPREKLELALQDPLCWASVLPDVASVEAGKSADGRQQAQLTFASHDRPIDIVVITPTASSGQPSTTTYLRWEAEGGHKAPVAFDGRWSLAPHHDGTRVKLLLLIDRKRWPEGPAGRIFSPDRVAEAVLGLEREALKK